MYSMYFVFSYFICPVYCSMDTNACQYVRIKKLLLPLFLVLPLLDLETVFFRTFLHFLSIHKMFVRHSKIRLISRVKQRQILCCKSGLGSSTIDQVLKYTKYPKYIPSTSTGQVLIFLKST